MTQVVLHIGTPKTGTTAIQHALATQESALADHGIAFLRTGRPRTAHNALANAVMRHGAEHKFRAALDEEMALGLASEQVSTVLLSSEIFALIDPQTVRQALPEFDDCPTRIVLYLRRQDQYAEAFYKQRLKNGRLKIPFATFLESKTCRLITDYGGLIDSWARAYPKAEIVPRLYEREAFPNGDIVADFATLLGLSPDALGAAVIEQNISPSREVIDILLGLAPHFSRPQLRHIYRHVKDQHLEGFGGKGDLFAASARDSYCRAFEQANEKLRKAWFADRQALFHPPDPTRDVPEISPVHRQALLAALLKAAFEVKEQGG